MGCIHKGPLSGFPYPVNLVMLWDVTPAAEHTSVFKQISNIYLDKKPVDHFEGFRRVVQDDATEGC